MPYEFNQHDLAYKHINGKEEWYVKTSAYRIKGGTVRQCHMNLYELIQHDKAQKKLKTNVVGI